MDYIIPYILDKFILVKLEEFHLNVSGRKTLHWCNDIPILKDCQKPLKNSNYVYNSIKYPSKRDLFFTYLLLLSV